MLPPDIPFVPVVDADGATRADAAAIASGIPSRALMHRAGAAAAYELSRRLGALLRGGACIVTGSGNNGGDGWIVAAALHASGARVRVVECAEPRTPDARAEREAALAAGVARDVDIATIGRGEAIVVDALLGTGFRGDAAPRGRVAEGIAAMRAHASRGGAVVALDLPSGLDATTGRHLDAPPAVLTLSFGGVKHGHLLARELCGVIVVLDIGLGAHAPRDARLATPAWFRAALPMIAADAHKGTRGKVAIVGGAEGMAGAATLAARGALHAGAGMVRCVVAPASLAAIQGNVPAALASPWPASDDEAGALLAWADVVLVGPGLGRAGAREMVERVLRSFRGPVVLDADALNAFTDDADALAPLLGGRAALLTPHQVEFARLSGASPEEVGATRFTAPVELARRTTAAVLLKGVPTVVAGPAGGGTVVVAEGTPLLATGGSGDVLGGIAAALLAPLGDAPLAGALAAFAHGRAAAMVSARQVRGYTLDDLLAALPRAWAVEVPAPRPPVLATLPAVGEAAP